jgi:hypothetical protein
MSIASVQSSAASVPTLLSSGPTTSGRPSDVDTAAQEAAEGASTKLAEVQNGGYAPKSAGLVNKTA